jgi:hypothetical protein
MLAIIHEHPYLFCQSLCSHPTFRRPVKGGENLLPMNVTLVQRTCLHSAVQVEIFRYQP